MSLSEQLKDGTAAAHAAAESVLFVKNFIQGNIPLDLYKRLLAGLFHAYTAMERRLAEEAAADEGGIVDQVHFPVELNRVNSLAADLEHWLGAGWRDAPELEMSQCTREYVRRLEKATPAGLVAHAYTRYMGDLSGGQILVRFSTGWAAGRTCPLQKQLQTAAIALAGLVSPAGLCTAVAR